MYDKKSEAREFVANSRSEAVAEAARFFDAEEAGLRISDLEGTEVAGLAGRVVIVAAPASAPRVASGGGDDSGGGRGERGGRERGGRDRGDRGGRERGGRERGGRERGGRERGGRERAERDGNRDGNRDDDRAETRSSSQPEPVESKGTARGDLSEVGNFLLGAVERMRLGNFEIEEGMDGEYLIVHLEGDAASELGAGDGRGIDALQLLANQASMRSNPDGPRVIVDAEGSSEKRETVLSRLGSRAAKKALDSGRSVALEPMNPKDRRIVHIALREEEGIATISTGEGRYRQVVVVPEGAPEYDEARQSMQAAETND